MEKICQTGKKPLARNNKNKLASYQTLTDWWNVDFGFRSLLGFWIPWAVFRIPKPRIPYSTSKNFPNSLTRSYTNWIFSWVSASIGVDRFSFSFMFCFPNTEHVIFTREFPCCVFTLKSYAPEYEEMWKKKRSHGENHMVWNGKTIDWSMQAKKVNLLDYGFWSINHGSIRLPA